MHVQNEDPSPNYYFVIVSCPLYVEVNGPAKEK